MEGLLAELAEAKRRLAALVARKRAADVRGRVGKATGQASVETDAFRKFDRMREKVEQAEAEAEAVRELAGEDLAESGEPVDFEVENVDAEIEADLAELKKRRAPSA